MRYDVAVWTGDRLETDAAAARRYRELMAEMDRCVEAGDRPPSAPELLHYADGLLARYPDITSDAGEDSPWADGPIKDNIVGSLFNFAMTYSQAEAALPFIAERATANGLGCFDPQSGKLLGAPERRGRV